MVSLKNCEKTLVLLRFRTNMLKKKNGFTMFSLENVEKALVLLCFRSNMLKKQWFYKQRG